MAQENEEDEENFHRARRVKLQPEATVKSQGTGPANTREVKIGMTTPVPEHLQDLFNRSTKDLGEREKGQVAALLKNFKDSFSRDDWDIGLTNLAEHEIQTGNAAPIKQPPRRVPLAYSDKEKAAIEDMKAKVVIRESVSPWASPICLVSKKDGGVRLCVDYRKVNSLVKPDGFPLPRGQDCLDAVACQSG